MSAANAQRIALGAEAAGLAPKTAIVLGSGLSGLVDALADPVAISYGDLEGFPRPGVSGHAGRLAMGRLGSADVMLLAGRAHYYEHGDASAMRPALETLAKAGVTTLVLTNAAGSLKEAMGPGAVMAITDHLNLSGANPLIGEASDRRFVGLTSAYDAVLLGRARSAAARLGETLHEGVYAWLSGPTFETPAEIRMLRLLGADAVGMSTVPEVILARFLGLRIAAFSVVTNLAAGMTGAELSHEETKEMAPKGGLRLSRILTEMLGPEAGDD